MHRSFGSIRDTMFPLWPITVKLSFSIPTASMHRYIRTPVLSSTLLVVYQIVVHKRWVKDALKKKFSVAKSLNPDSMHKH